MSFDSVCDAVDAMVFSGDSLADPEKRKQFRYFIDRWDKELRSWETVEEFEEAGDV